MKSFFSSAIEVFEIALITIGAVLTIRYFLVQPFLVSGDSMSPNFSNGDYLLVDELTYRLRVPERGEVAVFHYPQDESTYFIKRVIAMPGERVVVKGGAVTIYNSLYPNGLTLDERYLPAGTVTNGNVDTTLGENEYFVLGDNRSFSFDSRSWGVLKKNEIVGLARLRLWPPVSFKAFAAPQY